MIMSGSFGFGDVEGIIYQGVGAIQSEEPEHYPSGLYMVGRCHHFIMIIFAMVMEAMSKPICLVVKERALDALQKINAVKVGEYHLSTVALTLTGNLA